MRICSRAVEIDPYYADAWALLAIAQSSLRYSSGSEVDDGFAAANAALAIDPAIAEAHLPMVKRLLERRKHEQAAAEMEAAIRLGPESWEVNKEAGRFYLDAARHRSRNAALRESGRADGRPTSTPGPCFRAATRRSGRREKLRKAAQEDGVRSAVAPSSRIRATARRSAFSPAATPAR